MAEQVLIEVCVDSVASAAAAERGGAHRIELCSDLMEGGVTPSIGLLEAVRSKVSIAVHPIIRPRPGDFCYDDEELAIMRRDIAMAKDAGADGVVLGLLRREGEVDVARARALVELARPMSVTFHRAFDMAADLEKALEDLCDTGAARVLTSGGEQECTEGVPAIARLVSQARARIAIMACGGIRPHNAASIIADTGVREIHVGLGSAVTSSMIHRNSRVSLGKIKGMDYHRTKVLEENVRSLSHAVSAGAPVNGRTRTR